MGSAFATKIFPVTQYATLTPHHNLQMLLGWHRRNAGAPGTSGGRTGRACSDGDEDCCAQQCPPHDPKGNHGLETAGPTWELHSHSIKIYSWKWPIPNTLFKRKY